MAFAARRRAGFFASAPSHRTPPLSGAVPAGAFAAACPLRRPALKTIFRFGKSIQFRVQGRHKAMDDRLQEGERERGGGSETRMKNLNPQPTSCLVAPAAPPPPTIRAAAAEARRPANRSRSAYFFVFFSGFVFVCAWVQIHPHARVGAAIGLIDGSLITVLQSILFINHCSHSEAVSRYKRT